MHLNLHGKVVLVTGGTRGIGRAIVEAFLAEGALVYFCARTSEDVKRAHKEIDELMEPSAHGIAIGTALDISDPAQIEKWVNYIGQVDVLVSNVSSLSMGNDPASWTTAFNVDMLAAVNLVNICLPYLEKTRGSIVTISSVSGRDIDFTATSPYGAFKAALIHYTAQLAHTLAPKGIRANTVSPGNIYVADGVWGSIEKEKPALFMKQLEANVSGRMGKPSEVANAVVFLASEKASFISGTNLVVDGSLCTGVQF